MSKVFSIVMLSLLAISGFTPAHAQGSIFYIRFAHLTSNVPSIDIYVNQKMVASGVKYQDVTTYFGMDAYQIQVSVVPTGGMLTASLTKHPVTLNFAKDKSAFYTVAVLGSSQDGTLTLLTLPADGEAPPGTGKAGTLEVNGAYAEATASGDATPVVTMAMNGMTMGSMEPSATPAMAGMDMSAMGATSAVYMVIQNNGDSVDKLIGASSDAAQSATLHQTQVKNDVAQMISIDSLDIPAKGSVEFKPGGYHIMLENLKADLLPGQVITLTLKFASGTILTMQVPVKLP